MDLSLPISALPAQTYRTASARILHLIASVNPSTGGPAEGLRNYCASGEKLGHRFEIVCLDPPDSPWFGLYRGKVHGVGPARGIYGYTKTLRPWLSKNARDYDAVVVHGCWQYPGLAAIRELPRAGVSYCAFPHGMLDPWFKRTYPLKHLKKWIYWALVEYWLLKRAEAVLFTCEEEEIQSRQSFWLYSVNPAVIGYGISAPPANAAEQRSAFLSAFPQLSTTKNLLFLGRIDPKKGCDLLIRSFARIARHNRTVRLVMAGPDHKGWRPALERIANELEVSQQIVWAGMLEGDLKWGAFRCADAFVLPSHQENFGVAVVEAMACEVPVMLSDKVNIWREIVRDGAGYAEPDTQAGTDRLLQRWGAIDPATRSQMGKAAVSSYMTRFQSLSATQSLVDAVTPQNRTR